MLGVRSREDLVTVEHPDGIAAVVRDGREVWLTDALSGGGGTRLDDHRPVVVGLAGDRTLQGGLLPAGAAAAQVVDDAGVRRLAAASNGAWAIVLDQPCEGRVSPVCYRDADGVTVAPPPATWARAPVLDADEPCPACGATGWDEACAGAGSRGLIGRRMRPAPLVVCRACGHEHSVGVRYAATATADEPTAEAAAGMVHDAETRLLREARIALRDVEFAVYAARGRDGRIGGACSRATWLVPSVRSETSTAGSGIATSDRRHRLVRVGGPSGPATSRASSRASRGFRRDACGSLRTAADRGTAALGQSSCSCGSCGLLGSAAERERRDSNPRPPA